MNSQLEFPEILEFWERKDSLTPSTPDSRPSLPPKPTSVVSGPSFRASGAEKNSSSIRNGDNSDVLDPSGGNVGYGASITNNNEVYATYVLSAQRSAIIDNRRKVCLPKVRILLQKSTTHTNGNFTIDHFKNLLIDSSSPYDQDLQLLRYLFAMFDYHDRKQLPRRKWFNFLKLRLNRNNDERDLRESLEIASRAFGQLEPLSFDQFSDIFKTDYVAEKVFRAIRATKSNSNVTENDNVVCLEQVMDFISHLTSSRPGSHLTVDNIAALETLFKKHMGSDSCIDKSSFMKMFPGKDDFFRSRVFDIFDEDQAGKISFQTFTSRINQFIGLGADDHKVRFLLQVYGADKNGMINEQELENIMVACVLESGMRFSKQQIHELARALFEEADVDNNGALSYEDLNTYLRGHPGLLENLSISIDGWLVPQQKPARKKKLPYELSFDFVRNNLTFVIWLLIFLTINLGLFTFRLVTFIGDNPRKSMFLAIARASGICLNFNGTFILVAMLRQFLTFLRARGGSAIFPIDDNIFFHKLAGKLIVLFSVVHTAAHLLNVYFSFILDEVINTGNLSYFEFLFNPKATSGVDLDLGLISGYAYSTGFGLVLILIIMLAGVLPCIKRGQLFYWTHLLFVVFWIVLIIHCKNFWKWFVVPGIIFVLEQLNRVYKFQFGPGRTHISSAVILPSGVTQLNIVRPPHFVFNAGDYVFIRVPQISLWAWHPFTISSAPEEKGVITLHIRGVGPWTKKLHDFFKSQIPLMNILSDGIGNRAIDSSRRAATLPGEFGHQINRNRMDLSRAQSLRLKTPISFANGPINGTHNRPSWIERIKPGPPNGQAIPLLANSSGSGRKLEPCLASRTSIPVYIDGAYGAPSSSIYQAEHAVLIGAGIGVTPFASILQSVIYRYWTSKVVCPQCHHRFCVDAASAMENLKKVDFFWITRDQQSFEWFLELLSQLEIAQTELGGAMERFLNMHMYLTSALDRTDMRAVVLQLALDLLHTRENRDLISGLRNRTKTGRPKWNKIFEKIKQEQRGSVTVFFCGPMTMAKAIKIECEKFGFDFRKESF